MNDFEILNYNFFAIPPLTQEKYNQFFVNIKHKFGYNKIIYEKFPKKLDTKLAIDRSRIITEKYDKLAVLSIGNQSIVSMLWYKEYATEKHISINGGQVLIFDSILHTDRFYSKHNNNNLYSVVFCDFMRYNIKNYINLHDENNFNISAFFNIK